MWRTKVGMQHEASKPESGRHYDHSTGARTYRTHPHIYQSTLQHLTASQQAPNQSPASQPVHISPHQALRSSIPVQASTTAQSSVQPHQIQAHRFRPRPVAFHLPCVHYRPGVEVPHEAEGLSISSPETLEMQRLSREQGLRHPC